MLEKIDLPASVPIDLSFRLGVGWGAGVIALLELMSRKLCYVGAGYEKG